MGEPIFDGNFTFIGGQNAGLLPDRIAENQYESGINVTTIDGSLRPRPGFHHVELMHSSDSFEFEPGFSKSYQNIFEKGKFQALAPYTSETGNWLIAVVSGVIFKINPERCTVTPIPIEGGSRINQFCRRINWSLAGRFLVFFDFPDRPVIVDGCSARRSDPDRVESDGPCPEIPAAVIGAYNQNRLFIGNAFHEFTAGDPTGSAAAPDAPITFKEIFIEAAPFLGQSFSLGNANQNNPITAMGFLQTVDTTVSGIGPLLISTKDAIYTYQSDLARTQWENSQFGRQLLKDGIAGPRAFSNLNSDLIFMSPDGRVRSLFLGLSEERSRWSNTPISREVENWIQLRDPELASIAVVQDFGNRVFITVNPYDVAAESLQGRCVTDHAHRGMIVLELENVAGINAQANPVWAGVWTGVNPMEIVELDDELFIFSKDPNAVNRLYKLQEDSTVDRFEGKKKRIRSRFYTRDYVFGNLIQLKEEVGIMPTLSNLAGDINIQVDRKVGHAKEWSEHGSFCHTAEAEDCNVPECEEPKNLAKHCFREFNIGDGKDSGCDPVTGDDYSFFRKIAYRVTIQAEDWRMDDFIIHAETQEDDRRRNVNCDKIEETRIETSCGQDINDWELHSTPFDISIDEREVFGGS